MLEQRKLAACPASRATLVVKNSVAITGIGCVTGFGPGVERTWRSLLNGETAIHERPRDEAETSPTRFTTQAPPAATLEQFLSDLGFPKPPRTSMLALIAAQEAWEMAGLPEDIDRDRAGLILNRNFGQHQMVARYYQTLWRKGAGGVSGLQFVQTIANAVLGRVAISFQLRGPSTLIFGPPAFGPALDLLRDGQADVVLAGGLDELSDYVLTLCDICGLTPESSGLPGIVRPYDRNRAGLIPGDGAVFFVLEQAGHARARGAKPLAYLRGYSTVSDRRALSNPLERNSDDIAECIRRALRDADVEAHDVACVSGAGAGLRNFDEMELRAIASVFISSPPVFSPKGALGETWGAAGGLSLLTAALALQRGTLPASAGTLEVDPVGLAPVVLGSPMSVSGRAALALSLDMAGQDTAFVVTGEP